jgi:hypothetical protein
MAYLSKKKIEDQINFLKKFNHSNSMIFYMINNEKNYSFLATQLSVC